MVYIFFFLAVFSISIEPLQVPTGPYMYPFYMEKGLEVKKKLAAKRIYIPTLWPNAVEFGGVAKDYSENIEQD